VQHDDVYVFLNQCVCVCVYVWGIDVVCCSFGSTVVMATVVAVAVVGVNLSHNIYIMFVITSVSSRMVISYRALIS
jgi:hypothetical protein